MILALKLVLVPLLLWGITLVGRVLGPRIAGSLTGIPLVAGPIVAFIAVEQGPAFAARSATSTLAGEISLIGFCLAYAWGARRFSWWRCLLLGWGSFLLVTAAVNQVALGTVACLFIGFLSPLVMRIGLGAALVYRFPPPVEEGGASSEEGEPDRKKASSDLIWRMVAGATLVLLLTTAARGLGPRLSGLLTIFPIATAVLTAFSHRLHGPRFAVELMHGLALGMYSFVLFFASIALSIEPLGVAPAFAFALGAAVSVQAGILWLTRLGAQRGRRGAVSARS